MKAIVAAVAVLLAGMLPRAAHAERDAGVGIALSVPDIVGLVVSFYPVSQLSLDAHLSLVAVEGGLTGHIPVGGDWSGWRHDILVSGSAGWVHAMVGNPWLSYHGLRVKALAGYGLLGAAWDFRFLAGVVVEDLGAGAARPNATGMVSMARVF